MTADTFSEDFAVSDQTPLSSTNLHHQPLLLLVLAELLNVHISAQSPLVYTNVRPSADHVLQSEKGRQCRPERCH